MRADDRLREAIHRLAVIASQRPRECATVEAKQSIEQQEGKNGLLRRIRLRPKAGFGGRERSSQ
jgi:hypothetical protein